MPRKPKPSNPKKTCVKCNEYFAVNDEKYCSSCRAEVLKKMRDEGYLASPVVPVAVNRERRDRSQRSTSIVGGTSEMNHDGDDL